MVADDGDAGASDPRVVVVVVRLWMNAWDHPGVTASCPMDPYSDAEASFCTCEDVLAAVVVVGDCHHGEGCNAVAWSPVDRAYDDVDSCSR